LIEIAWKYGFVVGLENDSPSLKPVRKRWQTWQPQITDHPQAAYPIHLL
jgi:hypothetical protein